MKNYEEVLVNPGLILRWVREGDEYVNRISVNGMDEFKELAEEDSLKLIKAAQRMVDEFAPHADKCRPCTIEWQTLKNVLATIRYTK